MCFSRDIKSSNWSEWKIGAVRFTFIDKKMSHGISLQLLGVKLLMQEVDMQEEEITQHGVFEVSRLFHSIILLSCNEIGKYMYLILTRKIYYWLQDFSLSYIAGVSYDVSELCICLIYFVEQTLYLDD